MKKPKFKMGEFSLTTRKYRCGCWYRDLDETRRVVSHCAVHKEILVHLRKVTAKPFGEASR